MRANLVIGQISLALRETLQEHLTTAGLESYRKSASTLLDSVLDCAAGAVAPTGLGCDEIIGPLPLALGEIQNLNTYWLVFGDPVVGRTLNQALLFGEHLGCDLG